jgi:HEPN domain-containing protein
MKRKDFIRLAKTRISEADVLIRNRKYDGAYYLCGYAVECGLKACIAKHTERSDFPDKETVNQSYTHDLSTLIRIAGLGTELEKNSNRSKKFETNWTVTKDWSESSRYERQSEKKVEDFYRAITDQKDGVFKWIQHFW